MHHESHVHLAPKTTLGVGGAAQQFLLATSVDAVCEAVAWADEQRMPVYVLGGGSNIVVSDEGVSGLVVEMGHKGIEWAEQGPHMLANVQAGEDWDDFVKAAVEKRLAGVECLSGIPGRVGATPIQNVGAYGQDVSETIENVRCWDRWDSEIVDLSRRDCHFSYRNSHFKSREPTRYVVLSVSYRLTRGGTPTLRYAELQRALTERDISDASLQQVREEVLGLRRSKSMLVDDADPTSRSCGSFFVNPIVSADEAKSVASAADDKEMPSYAEPDGRVKLSAGWLIERAGFARGTQRGAARISDKHALALVADRGAVARDVLDLAVAVRAAVQERFGVRLVAEPVCWGFDGLNDGLPERQGEATQP